MLGPSRTGQGRRGLVRMQQSSLLLARLPFSDGLMGLEASSLRYLIAVLHSLWLVIGRKLQVSVQTGFTWFKRQGGSHSAFRLYLTNHTGVLLVV